MAIELPSVIAKYWPTVSIDSNVPSMAVIGLLVVYTSSKTLKFLRGLQAVNYMPGLRVPFFPLGIPGVALPTTWWNPGYYFLWKWRRNLYKRYCSENVSLVPFLVGGPAIYTSNLDVARQVIGSQQKSDFEKPEYSSRSMMLWGMNLISANGDIWRKHRRVVGPAFDNNLYRQVWKTTADVYHQILDAEGWADKKVVDIPIIQLYTFKLALLIIGICGFGFDINWSDPPRAPDGTMSLQEALRMINDRHLVPTALPKWVQNLPIKYLREYREAADQITHFMKSQVMSRKTLVESMNDSMGSEELEKDIFTMLVKANKDESGKFQLSDEELVGNVYGLLFAGHETTAHTLAATLAFLAQYPDLQEEIFEQIISIVGWDRDPEFQDYNNLNKVLAAFYEALRLYPSGHIMIRAATNDTILQIPNPPGEEGSTTMPVTKGTHVVVDMVGLQFNPRYFDEPEKYIPSRWHGIPNDSEAFSAFSVGPRSCIGRKFSTTEAVCFLSFLLRDWKIEPLLINGETLESWKTRVMDAHILLTLGIEKVPVRLVRRAKP